jgi:DNA-binding helix-hairpin-helix protein with protein kinase domain
MDANSRAITLDHQLASGGEGSVFTFRNDPTRVAKVYHRPPSAQTVEKLAAMIRLANQNLLSLAAWPTSLLYHARTRQLAGFVMPRLNDCPIRGIKRRFGNGTGPWRPWGEAG